MMKNALQATLKVITRSLAALMERLSNHHSTRHNQDQPLLKVPTRSFPAECCTSWTGIPKAHMLTLFIYVGMQILAHKINVYS